MECSDEFLEKKELGVEYNILQNISHPDRER